MVEGLDGLGGEVAGEEEECVYPLGSPVSREEFFVKIDVAFGIYAWVGLVRFKFDSAVDVIVLEGFVEVPPIAEDTKSGVPAVKVPVLRIIRVREQVHGGVADAVLSGALGACVGAYEVTCLCEEIVIAGVACIDGFFWGDPKESRARVCAGCVECGGSDPHSFSITEGECDIWSGERLMARVEFAVVGGTAAASRSAGSGR